MEDQSNPNAIERVRHVAQRRRALLILVGIGLLLLVLATANVCTDSVEWMNLDGDYWGAVGTGAGPPPQAPCSDCMTKVEAHSRGEELCNFTTQEDWDAIDSVQRDAPETWVLVIVGGSGGYATGTFDCIFGYGHALIWSRVHKWWNVHGQDGEDAGCEYRVLREGFPTIICLGP